MSRTVEESLEKPCEAECPKCGNSSIEMHGVDAGVTCICIMCHWSWILPAWSTR